MINRRVWMMMVVAGAWMGAGSLVEATCVGSLVWVATLPSIVGEAISVTWGIEPACDVIETGLLLGPNPMALTPVGQPIYGHRAAFQRELPVAETGEYWLAAYVRDEAGTVIQSPPQFVFMIVPPRLPLVPQGSHGPLPFYTGTDDDFLQPAGEPHFASLRRATNGQQREIGVRTYGFSRVSGVAVRSVSSTHRDEVLAEQAQAFTVLGMSFDVDPVNVLTALDQLDQAFQSAGFPRSGLYTVFCGASAEGIGQVIIKFSPPLCFPHTGFSFGPVLTYWELSYDEVSGPYTFSARGSATGSVTYVIPKPSPGQRVESGKLRLFVEGIGDLSAVRLSGKLPATIDSVSCSMSLSGVNYCSMWITWDFTAEAQSLAAQGGGELLLTLDPLPPAVIESLNLHYSNAFYSFFPDVNYPWRHGGPNKALTLTFAETCPEELKLSVTPDIVRPWLPPTTRFTGVLARAATQATVKALVKSCPPETGSAPGSVDVTFEVLAPEVGSDEAGGHAHNTQRPTGTFEQPEGPTVTSCVAILDAEGMGSCEVTYHPHEVSGVETIVATATGFPDAQAKVTVQVSGLQNLAEVGTNFWRLTGQTATHTDNHWGTTDTMGRVGDVVAGTVTNIQLVALDFLEFACEALGTCALLGINDMSLRLGGMFDIHGDWNPPHKSHRKGTSVDIDRTACMDTDLRGACGTTIRVARDFIERRCFARGRASLAKEETIHCEWPQ